jgi:hypothetical protein
MRLIVTSAAALVLVAGCAKSPQDELWDDHLSSSEKSQLCEWYRGGEEQTAISNLFQLGDARSMPDSETAAELLAEKC